MRPIAVDFSFAQFANIATHAITNILIEAAVKAKEDMQVTTIWFDTVAPDFTISVLEPWIVEVGPENTFGGLIWFYLDIGTRVRYATMTRIPPFNSKTRPHSLHTHSNNPGSLAYVNRNRPRPGIQAREWTPFIAKVRGKWMQDRIMDAIHRYDSMQNAANRREIRRQSGDFSKFRMPRDLPENLPPRR